jgi:hypothetical protein
MRLPRFSLRTLLVLVAFATLPVGWVAYQLDWIRQRHEFLNRPDWQAMIPSVPAHKMPKSPWPLALFGEAPQDVLAVHGVDAENASQLFPEAIVVATEP